MIFDTTFRFYKSSFGKDGFLSRGMTCDVLKMSGKTLEIKDKLTICVIGTNKKTKQDFDNSVGIGSRSHICQVNLQLFSSLHQQ